MILAGTKTDKIKMSLLLVAEQLQQNPHIHIHIRQIYDSRLNIINEQRVKNKEKKNQAKIGCDANRQCDLFRNNNKQMRKKNFFFFFLVQSSLCVCMCERVVGVCSFIDIRLDARAVQLALTVNCSIHSNMYKANIALRSIR